MLLVVFAFFVEVSSLLGSRGIGLDLVSLLPRPDDAGGETVRRAPPCSGVPDVLHALYSREPTRLLHAHRREGRTWM